MKQVNKWLKSADEALNHELIKIVDADGKVEEVFKGYISSFGAMVIQNGLPAALAINMKTDTGEGKQRKKIIEAIAYVFYKSSRYPHYTAETLLDESCTLANTNNHRKLRFLKQDVIDASIALKLMMRTYEFCETEKSE